MFEIAGELLPLSQENGKQFMKEPAKSFWLYGCPLAGGKSPRNVLK
ncbi:MAG: hypothetical protein ABJA02_16855 [Acidobacteriota bacterium]